MRNLLLLLPAALAAVVGLAVPTGHSWPPPYIGHLLDDDIAVGDGPSQYEPPPEIQEPTDPDYYLDHIGDFVTESTYSYSYKYTYTTTEKVKGPKGKVTEIVTEHVYEEIYDSSYYQSYFYFEETGEFMYVYTGTYEYTYNGVTTSYSEDYSYTYDSAYFSSYIKPYLSYYSSMLVTVNQELTDAISAELAKLKPVI